jgi:8-oxo-dGTP pyrophosphatase MutT (NUDIX family)
MNLRYNEEQIRSKLYEFDDPSRVKLNDNFFESSAVLFSILPHKNNSYDLVLIRRTNKGRKHRGEMSFPGGKFERETDKSVIDTALRETEEEIGVPRQKITLLGYLDDFPTMTKYIITPIIGKIDPESKLVKEEKEVKEIVKIPIEFFINKENFQEQAFLIDGNRFPIFYFKYHDKQTRKRYLVWGATAYMIATFLETVYGFTLSELGIQRFKLEKIRSLKHYIKHKNTFTKNLK